jgi:hypothetical protein
VRAGKRSTQLSSGVRLTNMRSIITTAAILLLFLCKTALCAELDKYIFDTKPALMKTVNSRTPQNGIPWCPYEIESDYIVQGTLNETEEIVGVRHGNYDYTLYRFTYGITKNIKGDFEKKAISFFIQRRFPTPESGIKLKELWPFRSSSILIFSINHGSPHLQIDGICK